MRDRWIVQPVPRPRARVRVFCFPCAGGAASAYRGWGKLLPEHVELCAVQLPGREDRHDQPPFTRIEALVPALAEGLRPAFDLPFVLFGHSLGALVAFELARYLGVHGGPAPTWLITAAFAAPHRRKVRTVIHDASDETIIEELARLDGTPIEALRNPELMRTVLPLLRADFAIRDHYVYQDQPRLDIPLFVTGGIGDVDMTEEVLHAWGDLSTRETRVQLFPGGHFFIHTARDLLLREIVDRLDDADRAIAPVMRMLR